MTTATTDNVGGNSKFDTYDYPGKYLNKDDGQALTKIRMQEEEAMYSVVSGTSNARSMVSGYKFTLTEHYRDDLNTSYLLTEIEHDAHTTSYGTSQGTGRALLQFLQMYSCLRPFSASARDSPSHRPGTAAGGGGGPLG